MPGSDPAKMRAVREGVVAGHGWYRALPWFPVAITGYLGLLLALRRIPVVARALAAPGMVSRLELPHAPRVVGVAFLLYLALGHQVAGVPRGGVRGIVVDLRAGDHRQPLVEQVGEGPDDPRLRLAPLAEEDDVVPGEEGVLQLRKDGLLVAEDPRHERFAGGDAGGGVAPDLLLHRHGLPARLLQLTQRRRP